MLPQVLEIARSEGEKPYVYMDTHYAKPVAVLQYRVGDFAGKVAVKLEALAPDLVIGYEVPKPSGALAHRILIDIDKAQHNYWPDVMKIIDGIEFSEIGYHISLESRVQSVRLSFRNSKDAARVDRALSDLNPLLLRERQGDFALAYSLFLNPHWVSPSFHLAVEAESLLVTAVSYLSSFYDRLLDGAYSGDDEAAADADTWREKLRVMGVLVDDLEAARHPDHPLA